MLVSGLGYFGLRTARIDAWRSFATDVAGASVEDAADGGLRLRVDDRAWRIALHPGDEEGFGYAGWEVVDAAALDTLVATLEEDGVEVTRADDALLAERGVMGLAWCTDPDGVRVELFHGAVSTATAFVSPTGARFVTGDQGLGHIVFAVDDYAATLDFYTRLLGFRVSDFCDLGRSRLAFLHVNPRHHSLAFGGLVIDPERTPRKALVPPGELFHFMLQVGDLDTVGRALDRCLAGAAPVAQGLGRHSNDFMTSFYAVTPSGFELEYGHGAIEVRDPWPVTKIDRTSLWGHHRPGKDG